MAVRNLPGGIYVKRTIKHNKFDERQMLARGKAFRAAYIVLVSYLAVYAFIDLLVIVWSDGFTGILIGICLSVTVFVVLLLPSVAPLLGCLMLGNLFKESGVTDRLSDTAQNALMNIVTIFLAVSVGGTALYDRFLTPQTIFIIILGLLAFEFATMGGLLLGKLMCKITGGKINPLIGSAGVSAVPMAARVSQKEGAKANPSNFLLMHAMGPNVAGVIGSAVAAGFMLAVFGG